MKLIVIFAFPTFNFNNHSVPLQSQTKIIMWLGNLDLVIRC
jgi:hypothetical protein